MIAVAIVRRRLREGKTYDEFRRAWYHETGFGTSNRMMTLLNFADPREVIVIGLTEASPENAPSLLAIDAAERGANLLDDVIEPAIDRTFGILVAEDDFSQSGPVPYQQAAVGTAKPNFDEVQQLLELGASLLAPYLKKPATR